MQLPVKTAVVTGAGSGIGRAVAQIFLEAGLNVVLTGRREEKLLQSVARTSGPGDHARCVAGDVAIEEDVDRVFDTALQQFGRVDVLFNNAGIGTPTTVIDELSVDDWQAVVDTNITGAFLCARRAFGIMRRQDPAGGRIINNGSISAQAPRRRMRAAHDAITTFGEHIVHECHGDEDAVCRPRIALM